MIDQVTVTVKSGNGGDGAISGRREKYVPRGGPDGGDGGDGGSIILQSEEGENTLLAYRYKKRFSAGDGGAGSGRMRHGKNGHDVALRVPVGTQVWVTNGEARLAADLQTAGDRVLVAEGGRGGRGNARFVSSTNRFPVLAEGGEPGGTVNLRFELKMISDVGIVGAPNAGKSSLLAAVSAARPRIAGYPFTTLEPVLGVVRHRDVDFVMADIPGLLEGAHEGVGLGLEFLRHVERTRVLVHVVDGGVEEPVEDYRKVRNELAQYSQDLMAKPEIIAINKVDIPGVASMCEGVKEDLGSDGAVVHCISAVGRQGIDDLLDEVARALRSVATPPGPRPLGEDGGDGPPVVRPRPVAVEATVRKVPGVFLVSHSGAERIAAMVDPGNPAATTQLHDHLRKLGVITALERAGISPGDVFRVGKLELEWG